MAEINGPDLNIIGLYGTVSLAFLTYHTYKFDGCRCLIPRPKDWYRGLLVWMLFLSNIALIVWAFAWAWVKYNLGWVFITGIGARPWPSVLFPAKFATYNSPLTVVLSICYALQAALTAQETLYWAHLMRATRRPQAAKPFLKSNYFYVWIASTLVITAIQIAAPWIGYKGDARAQLATELLTGGIIESLVLVASTLVVLQFPTFLRSVAATGAGPDVRGRLVYYHELNKARTFFRFLFTMPLLILGADGVTAAATINVSPLASDFLSNLTAGSLCIVMMISIILYLPRSAPSSAQNHVMVGEMPAHLPLMSLLREGGWETDGDLGQMPRGPTPVNDAPFAHAEASGNAWRVDDGDEWKPYPKPQGSVPLMLETFTSPIAVSSRAQPSRPVLIHIEVESDVRVD